VDPENVFSLCRLGLYCGEAVTKLGMDRFHPCGTLNGGGIVGGEIVLVINQQKR
jgi:hypothetical protein